jgi:HEAT repeat protein
MEFFKTSVKILLLFSYSIALSITNKNHILYLMGIEEYEQAIGYYEKLHKESPEQDFEMLQEMALILLEAGAKSLENGEKQLAMFGAGLAASTRSLKILEKGLLSQDMATQLTALHFACALQDNEINNLLIKAMGSDFLETRIEAALQMSLRKHPCAFGQIQSLMQRLPPFLKPFFPQFFGLIGTSDATRILKNLLFDGDPNVRVQAILTIAQNNKDELLSLLRKKIKHLSIAEQEAISYTLAALHDSSCNEELKKYCLSSIDNVKLAASLALYQLGDKSFENNIYQLAASSNLFAISALGKIDNSEEFLTKIAHLPNFQTRINGAIALLQRKDPRCLEGLKELLCSKETSYALSPFLSLGKSLTYFQVTLDSKKRKDIDRNLSLDIKQSLLKRALELEEKYFLVLAKEIFESNQNDLIPYLCTLLSNLNSDKAISLLEEYSIKAGVPLIRDYCNLTLYRMNIEGPYFDHLKRWLKRNCDKELIHLKPFLPEKVKYESTQYSLSPEESSSLLIDIFSVLAEKHSVEGIMLILDCLKTTNRLNRYPLAGILLRATE